MGSPRTLGELRAAAGLSASAGARKRGVTLQAQRKTERQRIEVTGLDTLIQFLGHLGVGLEVTGSGVRVIPEDHTPKEIAKTPKEKPRSGDLADLVRAAIKASDEVDHFSHEIFRLDLKLALEMYSRTKKKPDPRRIWDSFYGESESLSVKQACEMLDLPVPRRGQQVDAKALLRARNNKVRVYHPDRSGSEGTAPMFQQALDAYQVLVAYNASTV